MQVNQEGTPIRQFMPESELLWNAKNRVGIQKTEYDLDQRSLVSVAANNRIENIKISYKQKFLFHYRPDDSEEDFQADPIDYIQSQFQGPDMRLGDNRECRELLQDVNRLSRLSHV